MSDKYELWLDTLVNNLMVGAPVTPNPQLLKCLNDFFKLKEQEDRVNKRNNIIDYYTQDDKIEILEKRISELEEIIKNKK